MNFVNVAAYDQKSAHLLYGIVLKFSLPRERNSQLRMADLENYCGPHLQLKDGTPIVPDGAGYSNVSFPPGELVEILAPAPPADALEPVFASIQPLKASANTAPSKQILNVFPCLGGIWLRNYYKVAYHLAAGDKKND
jgi:hypothetical protein